MQQLYQSVQSERPLLFWLAGDVVWCSFPLWLLIHTRLLRWSRWICGRGTVYHILIVPTASLIETDKEKGLWIPKRITPPKPMTSEGQSNFSNSRQERIYSGWQRNGRSGRNLHLLHLFTCHRIEYSSELENVSFIYAVHNGTISTICRCQL